MTAYDVATTCLETILSLDPLVHAFQLVRAKEVLQEARRIDSLVGRKGLPLLGVPIAVKDNVDVAGCPTREGSAATPLTPAERDDELVRRLRDAGALIMGKTRTPELCIWPFTESVSFGITRNPWDLSRTAGGTSGGSAAAVAAGMVPLAIGSDGGGSIRIPAAACGVFGIKPSSGLVPTHKNQPHWFGLTEWGVLSNSVDDAALALGVLADKESLRSVSLSSSKLRIGASVDSPGGVRVEEEVRKAFDHILNVLEYLGHKVELTTPPYTKRDSRAASHRYLVGVAAEASHLDVRLLEARTRRVVNIGRLRGRIWGIQEEVPDSIKRRFERWFEEFDLLVTPTLATLPFRAGAYHGKGARATLRGATAFAPFTNVWNLVGYPAVSVPAGTSADGLPIGVQLVTRQGGDSLLLEVAKQLEMELEWESPGPLYGDEQPRAEELGVTD